MHYVLLTRVPSDPDAAGSLLESVAVAGWPVGLVLPHPAPESTLPQFDPDRVEWVRTGYSEPWFPLLPESEIARQIEREAASLVDRHLTPGPLWLTGPWATHLPGSFRRAGVEAVLIDARALDIPSPGVVAHLDAVLPVLPVVDEVELDDHQLGEDQAIVVSVAPERLPAVASELRARRGCDLTTVTSFLATHRPSGRRRPVIDDWEARFASDPDRFVLHRKLVRLVTRVPDRLGASAEQTVLEAERSTGFADDRVQQAHAAIVAARAAIDGERRRGDDWWRVSRLDWDADGGEEVHVELKGLSLVVAPHRSGAIPTLDCKTPVWPVSAVAGEPGWILSRFSSDLEGLEAEPIEMAEVRTTEVRGGTVELELAGTVDPGSVTVEMKVHDTAVELRYRLTDMVAGRIGPELKLNMGEGTKLRVDGSEWIDVSEPLAIAGHKIRITDGDHQAVLATLTPCSVFVRPGVDGAGITLWPHWASSGDAVHEITIDLTPPTAPA